MKSKELRRSVSESPFPTTLEEMLEIWRKRNPTLKPEDIEARMLNSSRVLLGEGHPCVAMLQSYLQLKWQSSRDEFLDKVEIWLDETSRLRKGFHP